MELSLSLFILSLTIAIIAPLVVVRYLRPILLRVLNGLCDADGSAEFWVRCVYILAVSGTLLLVLLLGDFNDGTTTIEALRRALVCVFLGVFITVALVAHNVWGRVQVMLARQNADAIIERGV